MINDKSKCSYDYSNSKSNKKDIISKAKESIYKFQNKMKPILNIIMKIIIKQNKPKKIIV